MDSSKWAALAIATFGIATAGCGNTTDRPGCGKAFDRAAWVDLETSVEPTVNGRSRRAILVDGLIDCNTLAGARSARVRQLLGDPDRKSRTDDGARLWVYVVGPGSLGLRAEELVVRFKESRVAKTYRTR
jgi:hypothetical protein